MIRRLIEQLGMLIGGRVGAKMYEFGGATRHCYKNRLDWRDRA